MTKKIFFVDVESPKKSKYNPVNLFTQHHFLIMLGQASKGANGFWKHNLTLLIYMSPGCEYLKLLDFDQ